jgi:hypothetical protein
VEIGVTFGWDRWVGDEGAMIGLDHFGASAPAGTIFRELGFTVDHVAEVGRRVVRDGLRGRVAAPPVPGHRGAGAELEAGSSGVERGPDRDPGHS